MSTAIDPIIFDQLNRFAKRQRLWTVIRSALIAIAVWIVAVLMVTWIDAIWVIERGPRSAMTLATYAAAIGVFLWLAASRLRGGEPLRRAAIAMEGARPEMRDRLLSAVELAEAAEQAGGGEGAQSGPFSGSLAFIQAAQRDVAFRIQRLDIRELLPTGMLKRPFVVAAGLVAFAFSLVLIPHLQYGNRFARAIIPGIDLDRVSSTRIRIIRPEPAGGAVPANELTAVTVETLGWPANSATLQWQTDDGGRGAVAMNRLDDGDAKSVTGEPASRLAANLPVGEIPIGYRILAGDGVTAWHRLVPRPRPEVVGFEITVTPPEYSRLPSESFVAEDGELRVLRGSLVNVQARFDMPVVDAALRMIGDDLRVDMNGGGDTWSASHEITQDDRYQVLATSEETGFDNPLSPQYAIIADPDRPPVVVWGDAKSARPAATQAGIRGGDQSGEPHRRLVTSRSTLSMSAVVTDEMPIDRVFQESAINGGPWVLTPLDDAMAASEPSPKLSPAWSWDLTSLASEETPLKPGDWVRSRVVAIDRLGQRGESEVREYLISDQALDVRRRENVSAWATLADAAAQWRQAVVDEMIRLGVEKPKEDRVSNNDPDDPQVVPEMRPLADRSRDLLARMVALTRVALHDGEAGELEMLGRAVARIDGEAARAASDLAGDAPATDLSQFGPLTESARWVEDAIRQATAHRVAVTLAEDFDRILLSMRPLADENGPVQWESFGRYHRVTQQQFRESIDLIVRMQETVPDSSRNHNDQLRQWIESWATRLSENESPDLGEQRVRDTTRDLINDLGSRRRYGMLDGRLPSLIIESQNRLDEAAGWTVGPMQNATRIAQELRSRSGQAADQDSEKVRQVNVLRERMNERLASIGGQLDRDAEMNLRRPGADRRYVADARLMRRVLDTLRSDDFVPPENKPIDEVMSEIKVAYHQLEAGHWWNQWLAELRSLADTERWDIDSSSARLDAPMRWERIQRGLDQSLTGLDQAGIGWDIRQPMHNAVHAPDRSKIGSAITARRWQKEESTSLADDIDSRYESLITSGQSLVPAMDDARRRLQAYLPNLGEMARDAASELREAEKTARQEKSKAKEAAESLRQRQETVQKQAEELSAALVDEANTQDLTSAEGIRQARDADIAARAIDQQMQAASAATDQAVADALAASEDAAAAEALQSAADPLGDAARTLEQIAEHYENRSRRPSDSETPTDLPPSLAGLEEELGLGEQLDKEFARSQSLAEALQSDPRDLLKKLSQELNRNVQMRDELNKIAERSMQDAQRALNQQAERERQLRLELERQDPQVLAEKRRLEEAIRAAAEQAGIVHRSMLHTAKQAAAKLDGLPEAIGETAKLAQDNLELAADRLQAVGQTAAIEPAEQELLADLRQAAGNLQSQLGEAIDSLRQSDQAIDSVRRSPEASLAGEPQKAEQRDMQNLQRQSRDTLAGALRNAYSRLNQAASNAEQQTRQAQAEVQQAERQLGDVNNRLARDPDNRPLRQDRLRMESKVEKAKDQERLSQAELLRRREALEQTRERIAEVGRTTLPQLDSDRPAGELTQSMQGSAGEDLKKQLELLAAAAQSAEALAEMTADGDQLSASERAQAEVRAEVLRAAENLERAARHQDRLGDRESSELTAQVAQAVGQVANEEVAGAESTIAGAARQAASRAEAGEAPLADASQSGATLGQAQAAIAAQAQALLEAIAQAAENAASQNGKDRDAEGDARTQAARQLAQTLDEVDRSLTQSRRQQNSQSPEGESQDGQPQPGDEGEPSGEQGQGKSPDPSDGQQPGGQQPGGQQPGGQKNRTSPTLAEAARRQMQQMAMRRTLPGEGKPGDSSGPQPQDGESEQGKPGETEPGEGESKMSGPGKQGVDPAMFGITAVDPDGASDWGKLRTLEAEDTSVQRRVEVSPEFRAQIEAYFRAIAEKARQP
jgi:hypothetical protein